MTGCIFNDEWAELKEVVIPIQSEAVQYGTGLFETMRTYENKSMPFIQEHLSRLFYSMADLQLACDYNEKQIQAMIQRLVEKNKHELQRIKVLVIPDGVLVTSVPLNNQQAESIKLTVWNGHRGMAQHKSTSYIDCHLAWQMAQINGYDDSILIDDHGMVYETGRANLFWVSDDVIYTREHHVLPGVMRDFVLTHSTTETVFENISLGQLLDADEVFITNSIIGVRPVSLINDSEFKAHMITAGLQAQLAEYVSSHR